MTHEEAIEKLKILKEDYWEDDGYGHESKLYDDTVVALEMAIKALEQEPILDKIIAGIMKLDDINPDYPMDMTVHISRYEVLQIIDKYRAESKGGADAEKWIDHSEDGYVECPICGHLTTCEGNIEDLHYCFWCGSKMEGAKE